MLQPGRWSNGFPNFQLTTNSAHGSDFHLFHLSENVRKNSTLAKFLGRLRDNDRATLVASMVAGGSKLMLSAFEISLDFEGF